MNEKKKLFLAVVMTSIGTTIVIAVVVIAGLWAHRDTILSDVLTKSFVREDSGGVEIEVAPATLSRESAITEVVKKANPAVVAIAITKDVPVIRRFYNSPFDSFFDEFFGTPPRGSNSGEGMTERREVGGGSGFFVSSDGLIMTNRHVISDTDAEYTVFTNDGVEHKATVVARDPSLDIGLIKIGGGPYSYLTFDTGVPTLGETATAIGNALGEFRNTVSVGVVSGLSRSIVAGGQGETEVLDEMIQTDAAINPGNSGGPLINIYGRVIGVNVAVASGAQNVGFALPAQGLAGIVSSVKKEGRIVRPYIGVRYVTITPALKAEKKLSVDYGVLISVGSQGQSAVIPNSPAAKAGLKEGDIITEINGMALRDKSFSSVIRERKVGETIRLTVLRSGATQEKTVVLEELR